MTRTADGAFETGENGQLLALSIRNDSFDEIKADKIVCWIEARARAWVQGEPFSNRGQGDGRRGPPIAGRG